MRKVRRNCSDWQTARAEVTWVSWWDVTETDALVTWASTAIAVV